MSNKYKIIVNGKEVETTYDELYSAMSETIKENLKKLGEPRFPLGNLDSGMIEANKKALEKQEQLDLFFIDDGGDEWSAESPVKPIRKRPEAPKVRCYICDKEPQTLGIQAHEYYDNPFYFIHGKCCGQAFHVDIKFDDIEQKGVKTYVVNLG